MSEDAIDIDQSQAANRAQTLQILASGPLSSSVTKLSGSSRCVPSDKDFHFYYSFDEFKNPIEEISKKSQSMLETIGTAAHGWGKEMPFPEDVDDAYDWLVNVNDELFERFDVSVDEFQTIRRKEEETGKPISSLEDSENGFQLVCGNKSKGPLGKDEGQEASPASGVKVATKDKKTTGAKPKVPFHIPSIRRPQDEFNILVNNSNQPFEHVWLQRSEDGQRFIHPLEKLSVFDFVDKDLGDLQPVKPPPMDCTPFKLVADVKDLKQLAAKLRGVNEFAVDLEHNQYRSFQGLTCLMQISTRTEDFIVDTFKLRIHVGPYLREVFKDPTKRKVMHGADRDIVWLQRDFGIYICNLFDTGQASRVLKLERNSLEYLLHHFCGVTANKEYQNADWRLRPLPEEMIKYAREDTHYLLHIYDLMRIKLFSTPKESENSDAPLLEVYKRSYDVCMQLYEKELLTEHSYLHIYGLQPAGFNAQQLAIVAGLCEWRDVVARAEDESTGYVLPNKTLLEIAKQMPVTTSKLRRLVKSKHPYVDRNLDTVVSIVRHSIQNATAFEAAAEYLKLGRIATASQEIPVNDGIQSSLSDSPNITTANARKENIGVCSTADHNISRIPCTSHDFEHCEKNEKAKIESNNYNSEFPRESLTISLHSRDANIDTGTRAKDIEVTVQVRKKPTGAFGSLLGNSAGKRKLDIGKKCKEEVKVEQIRASVSFPFQSFSGRSEQLKTVVETPNRVFEELNPRVSVSETAATATPEDIIKLDDNSDEELSHGNSGSADANRENNSAVSSSETKKEEEPMSLSDLSSNFQKCFQSINQNRKAKHVKKAGGSGGLQLKPFDYEAARKQVRFGEEAEDESARDVDGVRHPLNSGSKKKSSAIARGQSNDLRNDLLQGKRRQAFPATGNRSATFR
ncbi:Protein RRP6-like 2 [Quillaja saponaria]|uniref:Protein RRP6-like 2 n=1 Tax=Quillaja saponaria TaxID=32244 RepID=A0AAD7VDL6_QUISA|nr:Protein RRP6-like 2 [Quillaja saponaria]